MGIDYNADLGYGFVLPKEEANELNDGAANLGKKFEIAWAGDAYNDEMQTFVFIKASAHSSWAHSGHEEPLEKDALVIQPDWDELLKKEAAKFGINQPKIGWWLLCSVS